MRDQNVKVNHDEQRAIKVYSLTIFKLRWRCVGIQTYYDITEVYNMRIMINIPNQVIIVNE